jgi:hypothetical protein
MLFQNTWERVLDGSQTEISLPIKAGEVLFQNPTQVKSGSRTIWRVGKNYAVQPGKGENAVSSIVIQEIKEGVLGQLDMEAVLAEGFNNREQFIETWKGVHGNYDPNQRIWILRFEREPTPEERAARTRIEQEQLLWKMANSEFDKLSAAGHVLGEWRADGDLRLKNTCSRCQGSVTVSVGEINMVGYIPLMNSEVCLADYPERMEAAKREWESRLAQVYRQLLTLAQMSEQSEVES